jgi:hypothetical protein
MFGSPTLEGSRQLRDEALRQHADAVFVALGFPDHDLAAGDVEILDAEVERLREPQASPVEQRGDRRGLAGEGLEQESDFVVGQDRWQSFRSACPDDVIESLERRAEHRVVEEEQRRQRLVLGRSSHVPLDGQAREKLIDRRLAQRQRVLLAVKEDEATNPGDVGPLGAAGEMHGPGGHADAIEQLGAARRGLIGNAGGMKGRCHGQAPAVDKKTPQA